jgi:putative DNA primase/helicase
MQTVTEVETDIKTHPQYKTVKEMLEAGRDDKYILDVLGIFEVPPPIRFKIIREAKIDLNGENSRKTEAEAVKNGTYWDLPGNRHRDESNVKNGKQSQELAKINPVDDEIGTRFSAAYNGRLFVQVFGKMVRYVFDKKEWRLWNGKRWSPEGTDVLSVRTLALELVENKIQEDIGNVNKDDWYIYIAYLRHSKSPAGITALLDVAKDIPEIRVHSSMFDSLDLEINTPDGIYDVAAEKMIKPADPEHYHSRMTAVAPDFEMETPIWDRYLQTTFDKDDELISYIYRVLGYGLTGSTREEVAVFLIGPKGRSGKGTMMYTLIGIIGKDYMDTIKPAVLTDKDASDDAKRAEPELAKLEGIRFVECSETNKNQVLNMAKIKRLSGSDFISCQDKYQAGKGSGYKPHFTLFIASNHYLKADANDQAFWDRCKVIPFNHNFVNEGTHDDQLKERLKEEYPGILAKLLRGASEWNKNKLGTCTAVLKATGQYQSENDTLAPFIAECCIPTPNYKEMSSKLRSAYDSYCEINDIEPVEDLKVAMEAKNYPSKRSSKGVVFVGIKVRDDIQIEKKVNALAEMMPKQEVENNVSTPVEEIPEEVLEKLLVPNL